MTALAATRGEAQVVQPVSITSIASTVTCPVTPGTTAGWRATAVGGVAPLEYAFYLLDETTAQWTTLRGYSVSNYVLWTPPVAHTYRAQVWIRSFGSTAAYEAWGDSASCMVAPLPAATIDSFTASPGSPGVAGVPVTWTASVSGGTPPLEYRFLIRDEAAPVWTTLRTWSPSNQVSWTPIGAGTVTVQAQVRSGSSSGPPDATRNSTFHVPLPGTTTRATLAVGGAEPSADSALAAISADARYVLFTSTASNLVAGDTNNASDCFVRDRQAGVTTRVGVGTGGLEPNDLTYCQDISADGRYVLFLSLASNMAPPGSAPASRLFVHDRVTATTTRVDIASDGTTPLAGSSGPSSISADGRYVAFASDAPNLVPGDTNSTSDVFVHDRRSGVTTRVSVASDGTQSDGLFIAGVSLSADGRHVAFATNASTLAPGDTFVDTKVFVHDRLTGTTRRVSSTPAGLEPNGTSQNPSISADGRYVAFDSRASNLVPDDTNANSDVFVTDVQTGTTVRVSEAADGTSADQDSSQPRISATGRFVAFTSWATNLVSGDTNFVADVFERDLLTGAMVRASVSSAGVETTQYASAAAVSAGGRAVAFHAWDTTLVPGDTNFSLDVFVRLRGESTPAVLLAVGSELAGIGGTGTAVTWTAYGTGGTSTLEYAFYLYSQATGTWTMLRDYAASPSLSWTPTPGTYYVQAWVRSSGSGLPQEAVKNSEWLTIPPTTPVVVNSVAHSPTCPAPTGRPIATAASAAGGALPLEYSFWLQAPNGSWTQIQAYGPSRVVNWIPQLVGTYTVQAWVRSQGSAAPPAVLNSPPCAVTYPAPVTSVTVISVRPPPLTAGVSQSVRGAVIGGAQPYEYEFWREDSPGTWTLVRTWGPSASILWTPTLAGSYRWQVWARSVGSPAAYDAYGELTLKVLAAGTSRLSVATGGTQGTGASDRSAISNDGTIVAFDSRAPDLVANDTNGTWDVFVRDRLGATTTRVSLGPGSVEANGTSFGPAVSADGRHVAFVSNATNLVGGDSNAVGDVFVFDRTTASTTRASVGTGGTQGNGSSGSPAISADGHFVAFASTATTLVAGDGNGVSDVFVRDLWSQTTTRVSVATGGVQANGGSFSPAISADGRYVAFDSVATNLVAGDTNGYSDVFVHDRLTGTTTRISVATGGTEGTGNSYSPSLSADGVQVVFESFAPDLVAGDTNGTWDAFLRNRVAATTTRVSLSTAGAEGAGASWSPAFSADGRFLAFQSTAANLVTQDSNNTWDILLRDLQAGTTRRISVNTLDGQVSGANYAPRLSGDGRFVAFSSFAPSLVSGDSNGVSDVFLRDTGESGSPSIQLVSYALNTWTTYASGGSTPLEYRFYLNTNGSWSLLRDWASASTAAWTPPGSGTYYVQAWVRRVGSPAAQDAALNSATVVIP